MKVDSTITIKLTDEEIESTAYTVSTLFRLRNYLNKNNIPALKNVDTGDIISSSNLLALINTLGLFSEEYSTWDVEEKA